MLLNLVLNKFLFRTPSIAINIVSYADDLLKYPDLRIFHLGGQ